MDDCTKRFKDEHGFYKFSTFALFVIALIVLATIHIVCPVNPHKKGLIKRKKNKKDAFTTQQQQSLSNAERRHLSEKYSSILKSDPAQNRQGLLVSSSQGGINLASSSYDDNNITRNMKHGKSKSWNTIPTSFDDSNVRKMSSQPIGFRSYDNTEMALKRCSSSQELSTRRPSVTSMSAYNSMPNVNQPMESQYNFDGYQASNYENYNIHDVNHQDEGQIQCVVRFEKTRSLLLLNALAIKATLPVGVPGILAEVTIVPKNHESVRSKVYVTTQRNINITLDEQFVLTCNPTDLEYCSMVVTVKPILSSVIFYAETELKNLNLMRNDEIYIGGFLKGVYTNYYT